jgi:hypothetical protein
MNYRLALILISQLLLASSSAWAGRDGANDNGTSLTAAAEAGAPECTSTSSATVTLSGTLTTTGSVDSATITASIDGGAPSSIGVIQPQDFSHAGRIKTASYSFTFELENGTHTITLCFTQSGAQGRYPKSVCAAPVTVTVDCAVNQCRDAEVFGDLVGNPNLCAGNGRQSIPVHAQGDFGDNATLTINGPNGYSLSVPFRRSGDSCIYQYNWDATENGGGGVYTFTVAGNGQTFEFTADLRCR